MRVICVITISLITMRLLQLLLKAKKVIGVIININLKDGLFIIHSGVSDR